MNFATEHATVRCDAVGRRRRPRRGGRGSRVPRPPRRRGRATITTTSRSPSFGGGSQSPSLLTVPLALLAMIPPLRFPGWEWVALALATPVVFWSGAGFHRAALQSARHLTATMDTLISLGTLAA